MFFQRWGAIAASRPRGAGGVEVCVHLPHRVPLPTPPETAHQLCGDLQWTGGAGHCLQLLRGRFEAALGNPTGQHH